MTLLGLTFRLQRWSILAYGLGLGLLGLLNSVGFVQTAGSTPADQAQFGHAMEAIASRFTIIAPLPVQVGTMAGYMQWRYFGAQAPIIAAIWAVTAGTAVRGDEEKGLVELWISSGLSRFGVVAWRALAFALALLGAVVAMAVLSWAGAQPQDGLSWGGLIGDGLAIGALTLALFAAGVLAAQLVSTRRGAAGLAGGAALVLFLLNGVGRTDATIARFRGLSPFYWHERTNALLASGRFDVGATLLLLVIAVALLGLAGLAFRLRDLGSPLVRIRLGERGASHRAAGNPALELPVIAGLYEHRVGLAIWTLGMAAYAYLMVAEAKPLADAITGIPALAPYLTHIKAAVFVAFLDVVGFGIAAPLLAVFAIGQVSRWAGDDTEGRLEMMLAAGAGRDRVVVERIAALTIATALLAAVTGGVTYFSSRADGFDVDAGRLAAASALLVLLSVCFGVAGSLLAGWRPRVAVGVLTLLTVAGYFITELGPIFRWPGWVDDLSPFHLYGNPLSQGVYTQGLYAMIGITVVGTAISLIAMRQREVGR